MLIITQAREACGIKAKRAKSNGLEEMNEDVKFCMTLIKQLKVF